MNKEQIIKQFSARWAKAFRITDTTLKRDMVQAIKREFYSIEGFGENAKDIMWSEIVKAR